ncbi:hypothetical protein HMI55_007312, partial [Coelomomyces lativittatus]
AVGTHQELEAINYILDTLKKIQYDSKAVQPFEFRLEAGFGHHLFEIIQVPIIKTYYNVTNIAVRFSCQNCLSNHSILINSHFDSIYGSAGAADAATPISVMLECVRMLAHSPSSIKNSIVFLFNGAEETLQDASHAFIKSSNWFKGAVGVINLEAGGVGGKTMLFQAKNAHMLNIYKQSTYPHGSSLANDLFRTGLIISDTDYKQFMDHGHLNSGLDIAFYENSYFYHTRFDIEENILPGSIQHMGQNLIDMLHYIAQSENLENLSSTSRALAYFDFLGLVFIVYPVRDAQYFYILIILVSCAHLMSQCQIKKLLKSFLMLLKSIFYSLFFPFVIACFLHFTNSSLLWYSNISYPLILYLPPIFMGHLYGRSKNTSLMSSAHSLEFYEKQAQVLFMILEILVLSYFEVTGVFFHLIHLTSLLVTHYCVPKAYFYHVQFLFPFCIHIPSLVVVLKVFVPLAGRMGSATPAELILVIVLWLFTLHLFFFFTPLLYRCKYLTFYFRWCVYVTILFILWFRFTVPTFTMKAPQRLILFHHDSPSMNISELHLAKVAVTPFPGPLIHQLDTWLGPHHIHPASKQFTQLSALFPFSMLLQSLHWDMHKFHDDVLLNDYIALHTPNTNISVVKHPESQSKTLIFHCHLNAHNMMTVFQFQALQVLNSSIPIRPYTNHTYYIRQSAGSKAYSVLNSDCDFILTVPIHLPITINVAGVPRTLGRLKQIMQKVAYLVNAETDLIIISAIVTQVTV